MKAAEDPKLGGALLSKEHTLYLSFLGPNNPSLSSPKFGSCQCVLCQCGTILLNHYALDQKEHCKWLQGVAGIHRETLHYGDKPYR